MKSLILVLGDQLSPQIAALNGAARERDIVLMAEVAEETRYAPHHKQKVAFILAAMRHFAQDLRARDFKVDYIFLDDPANTGSFTAEVARAIARHRPDRIVATWPGEWRILEMMRAWPQQFAIPVEIREDDRFMCAREDFRRWARDRKNLRMEFFYRDMRRKSGILMDGGEPVGGQWNFDAQNRRALPQDHVAPARLRFDPDPQTQAVIDLVGRRCADHFGSLEEFGWPVTRAQALQSLDHFIASALPLFGDYQDAMRTGESFLYHSMLSAALNIGLLTPMEVCRRAEEAFHQGCAPLNSVEGFIRQILGWREFVHGLYWLHMPAYAQTNALDAQRELPDFYWTGETAMACVKDVVETTRRHGYAHHIQRLMVTGNLALLSGVRPAAIEEWYLAVYVDAFDWVELPNTHGMAIFADGGLMASKPYAASGAYINRMSNYCRSCRYDVTARIGTDACPFNFLYWNFLIRHEKRFATNPRMALAVKNVARLDAAERRAIQAQARAFLDGPGERASRQIELPL